EPDRPAGRVREVESGSGKARMDIVLLGPVQVRIAGRPVRLGAPQHRLVLGVLALEVNRLVPVDRLVELMWPASPPRTAIHAVQVAVSRLRGLLAADGV